MKKISVLFLFLLPILLAEGWVHAQSVGLRMTDTTSVQGTILEMPLYVDSTMTGKEVYSYSFQLSYNPYYLQPESPIITGTVGELLGMPVLNTSVSGIVSLAAAGTAPLTGKGKLVIIRWILKNPGWISLSFTDVKHNYLNEGSPAVTFIPGHINIQQAPTITIYPDTKVIAKGDQLQMNVYGGTAPYAWYVTNGDLAGIDQNGLLTTNASGIEKVVAMDAYGVRDTTQIIEIRPLKLSVPGNLTQWEGATIDIPVLTTDLTGLNISSGNFQIGFNPNLLSPESIIQTGTLLESCQVFLKKAEGNVSVAFAGTTSLAGPGTLVYVRFKVLSYPWGTNIEINNALMNENLKVALSNGYFSPMNFKNRSIYPSEGALIVGESVELNLYGEAIPPWTWSVSDSTVANINQTGILKGKKHGQVIVSVIDSAGAPAYSNKFEVFDTRIMIPDTSICRFDSVLHYPLYLESLPHDSINSFQGELSYDNAKLSYAGMETAGTSTRNWVSAENEKDGVIHFASTGIAALQHSGVLMRLKFVPKAGFEAGSLANMHFETFTVNESSPAILIERNGSVSGVNRNTVSAVIQNESDPFICEGEPMHFNVFVINGGKPRYQWLKNGNPVSDGNVDTLQITGLVNSDRISCRVVSTEPCVTDTLVYSIDLLIHANPKPVAAASISGDSILLKGSYNITYTVPAIPFAQSYFWQLSDGVTGNSTSNSITVSFDNTLTSALIKVQGVNDCGLGAADSLAIILSPTVGLSVYKSTNALLYPNPVDDRLHIALNNPMGNDSKLVVFDATGRMLKVNRTLEGNVITFDFSTFDSGIYFVNLSTNDKTELFKIIKR
ncbi:MAG: cohesin domain-containing protein [Paludibacter sp.]